MIFHKFVTVIRAFFNSIANALWERDPIAIMRLEYDRSVEQLQEGRKGLEQYNADLKMTAAEAEIARIAGDLNFDVTTDFGQIEQIIQQKIDTNRGKVRVAADLSSRGVADIKAKERMESQLAEDVLQQYEVELGLKSPETTPVVDSNKNLGPATEKNT